MTDEELLLQAADRIEELVATNEALTEQLAAARDDAKEAEAYAEELEAKLATCEKYRDAYAECDRIGTQAVRDLEAKLKTAEEIGRAFEEDAGQLREKLAECEARLSKAVELLKLCRDMLTTWHTPSDPLSVMLNETLAELTGGKDD